MRIIPGTKTFAAGCLATTALVVPSMAQAQSAGCAAINGFSQPLLEVRVSETLTPLAFDAGETITLNASSVTSSQPVGTPVWAFADASLAGNFGEGAFSPTFPTSDTPVTQSVTVPDGGIGGLALTEFGPWVNDFLDISIMCALGFGAADELATLAAASNAVGRLVIVNSAGVTRSRGQDSLTTRDEVLSFTRVADPETGSFTVTQSTMDSAQMMGGLYTWVDLTGFRAEDDGTNRSYTGRGLQIGADMAVMPDMVVGLSLGVQDLDATVGAVGQDGVLRYLQPYMAYAAGAWSGEASLIYGWGDFTQTSGGGTGEGDTRLAALTFNGGYDIALDQGVTVTPMLGLVHGVERVEGVSGTLAGAGTETVRFTQASLGGEVSQSTASGEIFAGLHAEWLNTDADTALVSDLLVDDGWTGRLELGLSTEVGNGISLDTSVALSGLGGDLRSTSGALRFAFRF